VGTKLDLARAYIDMGDPDGARSILEEVLDEGDEAQKEEARQLLDSLA
jgi:pilus assembly protein FimV